MMSVTPSSDGFAGKVTAPSPRCLTVEITLGFILGELIVSRATAIHQLDPSVSRYGRPGLREAERDEFLLLREMHHRFANSFATLNGMLRREFGSSGLSEIGASVDRFEARVAAFGALHRFLTVGAEPGWFCAQSYIEQLCEALVKAILKPLGLRCEVSADTAYFPGECCELLGLVIVELVTNAAKHAFRAQGDGVVRVEFVCTTDTWTCMVSDNGIGNSVPSIGVGSRIIARLVRALGAELVSKSGPKGTSLAVRCAFQPEFSSVNLSDGASAFRREGAVL